MTTHNSYTPPPFTCPAVSVIIPMYNAEKYIAECLESILAQTFTNFEVIIVDDCSTDSSCAIVESYTPKFGGRLTLSHMETNTGSGALPRNRGLMLSRGEYVFNMDNDDMLTKTALEELYTLAKKFDVDIVYCDKRFDTDEDGTNPRVQSNQSAKIRLVDRPILETEDLNQRVQIMINIGYFVVPWTKFIRRRLLIEREIFFPHCIIGDDAVWTIGLIFSTKKILRVPNAIYLWRQIKDSLSRQKQSPQHAVNFWLDPLLFGFRKVDAFLDKHEFFRKNSSQRYAVLEFFLRWHFHALFRESSQLQPFEVYETIKQKFGDKFGEYDVLIPMLSSSLHQMQKDFAIKQREFDQLAAHAQEQVKHFNQFAAAANNRVAQLEAELSRLKS